jgi:hypothetical protein
MQRGAGRDDAGEAVVADTNTVWGRRRSNSSKRSGRLSIAEGSRNP